MVVGVAGYIFCDGSVVLHATTYGFQLFRRQLLPTLHHLFEVVEENGTVQSHFVLRFAFASDPFPGVVVGALDLIQAPAELDAFGSVGKFLGGC